MTRFIRFNPKNAPKRYKKKPQIKTYSNKKLNKSQNETKLQIKR